MALVHADRVKETSTTTGTGTLDLAGAETGFQSFVAGVGNGNTCYYVITDGTDWEVGIGTVTDASPDTLARTTVIASSNADAAVNWGAGTKTVFCTPAAALITLMLRSDLEGQGITGGAAVTPKNLGTKSTGTNTVDATDCPWQRVINGGAHTLDIAANIGSCYLEIVNNGSAGAITTSAFDIVDGDDFDTTNTNVFLCHIGYTYNAKKFLTVKAMQ